MLAAAPDPGILLIARLSAALYLVLGPWTRLWAERSDLESPPRDAGLSASAIDLWLAIAVALLISPASLPLLLVSALVWVAARSMRGHAALQGLRAALGSTARIALPGWLGWMLARVDHSGSLAAQAAAGTGSTLLPVVYAVPLLWACFSAIDLAVAGGDEAMGATWRVGLYLTAQAVGVLVLAAQGAGLGAGVLALLALVQLPMLGALAQGRLRWFSQAGQPANLAALLTAALALALQGA